MCDAVTMAFFLCVKFPILPLQRQRVENNFLTTSAAVQAFYDKTAEEYNGQMEMSSLQKRIRQSFQQKLLKHFKEGDTILDLGCGTGIDAVFAAQHGIRVVGVEFSAGMLEKARHLVRAAEVEDRVELIQMTIESLHDLDRGPFDGVISNFCCLNHVENLQAVANHLPTILKPSAKCIFTLFNPGCLVESIQKLREGAVRAAVRKLTNRAKLYPAPLFLYSSRKAAAMFAPFFQRIELTAFGMFVLDDGLRRTAVQHPGWTKRMERWDIRCAHAFPFDRICDMYILELEAVGE